VNALPTPAPVATIDGGSEGDFRLAGLAGAPAVLPETGQVLGALPIPDASVPAGATPAPPQKASPDAPPAAAAPLPALPPNSAPLVSKYVGVLAGRAYTVTFHSGILDREMSYWIYLPPGYGATGVRYPTLYMLHGGGGTFDEWAAYGLFDVADQAFAGGKLPPFIIVLPEGDKSFWANWAGDNPRWGDYLAFDVVREIDARFSTIPAPASRAIGGLSMGGWGALYQGFTHPDIFGVVGATSPSFYPDNDYLQFLGTGPEYASKDPLSLVKTAPGVLAVRLWVDIGQDDPWVSWSVEFHDALVERGVQFEWHLYPGTHNGEYWAAHVPDYLNFYAGALAR
jgi:enterochelin esterase-like enzyme